MHYVVLAGNDTGVAGLSVGLYKYLWRKVAEMLVRSRWLSAVVVKQRLAVGREGG